MKTIFIPIIVIAVLLGIGGIWLYAKPIAAPAPTQTDVQQPKPLSSPQPQANTPTISPVTATPTMITVNTPTPVAVTVQITDPTLIQNSVNLLRVGATGTQPTVLGQLQGNGTGTYTIQPTFNEAGAGQIQLQVSAAFRGQLKRVTSQIMQIAVWSVLNSTSSKFTAIYPPTLYLTETPAPGIFFLDSSPGGVAIGGGAPLPGSSEATSGFAVTISATPYAVSGSFDIEQYLSTNYPNSVADVGGIASTSIGGQPGYAFTFQNEEGGGKPVAVVYHNGYVYEIDYASTNYIAGFSDQDGLNAFNAVLQNFRFNQ